MEPIMLPRQTCTGCHACVAVCPKQCITMQPDSLGFLYPQIDNSICNGCKACLRICDQTKTLPQQCDQKIYAAKHQNDAVRLRSASGGMFTVLSDYVLDQGGVVVGAAYDEQMKVRHMFATTKTERDAMCGSKYTYSLCNQAVFNSVKEFLKQGRTVLFTGTPCQVSALKAVTKKEQEHLITVDILCHGIEAPNVYQDYIKELTKNGTVKNINFRSKQNGSWHICKTAVTYQDDHIQDGFNENCYFQIFVQDFGLRPSCYECNYADFKRVSDITIGDFWGIEHHLPKFDDPLGVSVVLTNTEKGKALFDEVKQRLQYTESQPAHCSHDQLNGVHGAPQDNDKFIDEYLTKGYQYIAKKYGMPSTIIRFKTKLYKSKLINSIRTRLKKVISR